MSQQLPKLISCLLLSIAAVSFNAHSAKDAPLRLTFGVHSFEEPSEVVRQYMPTLKMLETSMSESLSRDVDIRMSIEKDLQANQKQLAEGRIDFAPIDATHYFRTKQNRNDVRIIAAKNSMSSYSLSPWVAKPGMQDSVFLALKASLLNITNSKALTSLQAFGFVESHDSQFEQQSVAFKHSQIQPKSTARHIDRSTAITVQRLRSAEPELLAAEPAKRDQ